MNAFAALKLVHVSCVVISISLFLIRAGHRFAKGTAPAGFAYRVLPHINDTVLLLSAIGMLWVLALNPLRIGWLTAKIIALGFYILFGTLALKGDRPNAQRAFFLIAAILCFAYIVAVAITRRPGIWV